MLADIRNSNPNGDSISMNERLLKEWETNFSIGMTLNWWEYETTVFQKRIRGIYGPRG
jgi:hypothetical protein